MNTQYKHFAIKYYKVDGFTYRSIRQTSTDRTLIEVFKIYEDGTSGWQPDNWILLTTRVAVDITEKQAMRRIKSLISGQISWHKHVIENLKNFEVDNV